MSKLLFGMTGEAFESLTASVLVCFFTHIYNFFSYYPSFPVVLCMVFLFLLQCLSTSLSLFYLCLPFCPLLYLCSFFIPNHPSHLLLHFFHSFFSFPLPVILRAILPSLSSSLSLSILTPSFLFSLFIFGVPQVVLPAPL